MNKTGAVLVVLSVGALAALYFFARPRALPTPATPPPAAAVAPSAPVKGGAREFAFEIAAGKVAGPDQLLVRQGDSVVLRVRSDAADELHVHGYDLSVTVPAGREGVLMFVASKAGRFEVELHRAHRELGALEVHPR